jgi:hypothetical protein
MTSRDAHRRRTFSIDWLESREAPSRVGIMPAAEVVHHHRGRGPGHNATPAPRGRHDGPGHDANDNRVVAMTSGRNANDDNLPRHSGLDERPGHDANDDNLPRHSGKDDPAGHR